MNEPLVEKILIALVVAVVVYFIKSFFNSLRSDVKGLSEQVSKLEGSFEPLRKDIKENTIQLASAQAELKAVWRYIDAKPRSSDARPNH